MYAEKVSVSLPQSLMQFVEEYKISHQRKSRSQVVEEALTLLRERELEAAYRDAEAAKLANAIAKDFAPTTSDGLDHEAW
jgi:antitoxin ParD1/3/4